MVKNDEMDLPASYDQLRAVFESVETGSANKLDEFLEEAAYKYKVGMEEYVWKPGASIFEFMQWKVITSFFKLDMLKSVTAQVKKIIYQ